MIKTQEDRAYATNTLDSWVLVGDVSIVGLELALTLPTNASLQQFDVIYYAYNAYLELLYPSVPYKCKKVRKVRNFFWHFRTEILRIPAFFLPPKNAVFVFRQKPWTATVHGASLWYVAQSTEKTCRTQAKDLFFFCLFVLEISIKSEKNMPPSAR